MRCSIAWVFVSARDVACARGVGNFEEPFEWNGGDGVGEK